MKALIIVDVQNDFLPGGALAVPGGDAILPIINRISSAYEHVVATQDWHPRNHGSFAANHPGHQVGDLIDLDDLPQILWPVHCVQETAGADFSPALDRARIRRVFQKGCDPRVDSYSGFFDNGHRNATGLGDYLRSIGATDVHICGLATDYCVKFTALDAIQLGFTTHLLLDASRGVNLRPGDVSRAIDEMRALGVEMMLGIPVHQ